MCQPSFSRYVSWDMIPLSNPCLLHGTLSALALSRIHQHLPNFARASWKEPKPAAAEDKKKEDASSAQASRVLLLSKPTDNKQAKPLREGLAAEYNYAANSEARLAEHLKSTGRT